MQHHIVQMCLNDAVNVECVRLLIELVNVCIYLLVVSDK